jgi:parvulin-like peptidyl-prolyl isomerase
MTTADGYQPGSGFGALSMKYSDDVASRYRGGDIGWIADIDATARVPSEILRQAVRRAIGELGPVHETADGWFLVLRTDERPAAVTALAEAAPVLRRRMVREKQQAVEERYYARCLEASSPRINHAALDQIKLQPREQKASLPTMAGGR